jgi:hypothetical protein
MNLHRWLRDHPVALLVVAVAGFGVWVVSDLTRPPAPPTPATVDEVRQMTVSLPVTPAPVRGSSAVPRDKIAILKPGMSRVVVEDIIGAPQPDQLGPILVQEDGRVTYQTTYPIDLDAVNLNTVKPIRRRPLPLPPPGQPRIDPLLTLEFDASQPGHPLLRVQCPAELF